MYYNEVEFPMSAFVNREVEPEDSAAAPLQNRYCPALATAGVRCHTQYRSAWWHEDGVAQLCPTVQKKVLSYNLNGYEN